MTLALERETLAELKAAVIIFGAKSYSSLVHQQVILKIREAKQMVSKEEFQRLRDEQLEEITVRSKVKSEERKKIKDNNITGEEVIEDFAPKKLPKKNFDKKDSQTITTKDGETLRFLEEDEGFGD